MNDCLREPGTEKTPRPLILLNSLGLKRPRTQLFQRTDRAPGFASQADFPSEENQLQGKIIPCPAREDFHQVKFDFDRILIGLVQISIPIKKQLHVV